ncbi:MAG: hypothetical protein U0527_12840 [Candidatus Eisenbacteria bacterium]
MTQLHRGKIGRGPGAMHRQCHTASPARHGRPRGGRRLLALLTSSILIAGCGGGADKPTPPQPPPSLEARLIRGWTFYRDRDLEEARAEFARTAAEFDSSGEPRLGLAWTAAQSDSPWVAVAESDSALARGSGEDAWVARAFALGAAGEDSLALASLDRGYRAPYLFRWDPRVDDRAIAVLRAIALYDLGRYAECYAALLELEPELTIDLEAIDVREQLAAALDRLERLLP